jgi:hypothetical protein
VFWPPLAGFSAESSGQRCERHRGICEDRNVGRRASAKLTRIEIDPNDALPRTEAPAAAGTVETRERHIGDALFMSGVDDSEPRALVKRQDADHALRG